MKRKVALVASKTIAIYGFAAWVYIALCALVHPYTLSWRLTHFLPYPRGHLRRAELRRIDRRLLYLPDAPPGKRRTPVAGGGQAPLPLIEWSDIPLLERSQR